MGVIYISIVKFPFFLFSNVQLVKIFAFQDTFNKLKAEFVILISYGDHVKYFHEPVPVRIRVVEKLTSAFHVFEAFFPLASLQQRPAH